MVEPSLRAYFGHHKSATRWFVAIIEAVCRELDFSCTEFDGPERFEYNLASSVRRSGLDFLCYTNADSRYVANLTNFRGFHVIRDPRDIVVSGYFSHLYSHPLEGWPELEPFRQKLQSASKDEGLLLEIEFDKEMGIFNEMLTWDYSMPNVMELKMEDVTRDPSLYFVKIFEFLGIMNRLDNVESQRHILSQQSLHDILEKNTFQLNAAGRNPGDEDIKSHYRKGIPGDWMNHFTEEHVEFFKSQCNDLLVKLKYEQDGNWSTKQN